MLGFTLRAYLNNASILTRSLFIVLTRLSSCPIMFFSVVTEPVTPASMNLSVRKTKPPAANAPAIGKPTSQRVVGVSTSGTKTIIDFPEGTGSPFATGDAVTLTATNQSYLDFTHKIVDSVDTSAGEGGYFSTRIVVDHDSSAGNPAALLATSQAVLRKSFMVAARGDGSGTLHYQQVQHT